MALTPAEVLHIARLANLAITPAEVDRLTTELGAILAHIEQLNEVDTTGVPGTAHLAVLAMPLRDDVLVPGLTEDEALGGAARVLAGGFAVPRFVDE
jgi:aspartyl-tRNA(Asn)/glutamyl-tRNA(Gln) amidotransferase subunit C